MSPKWDEQIAEARRLRNLARYSEALALFEDAEQQHSNLTVIVEITKTLTLMGFRDKGIENTRRGLDQFSDTEQDKSLVTYAVMSSTLATMLQTCRVSELLKPAIKTYNQQLKAKPVERYTLALVSTSPVYIHAG